MNEVADLEYCPGCHRDVAVEERFTDTALDVGGARGWSVTRLECGHQIYVEIPDSFRRMP